MPRTMYIAETDDANAVATVWVKPGGKATAKVFDPKKHIFDPREEARFSGASEAEIKRWLAAKIAARQEDARASR